MALSVSELALKVREMRRSQSEYFKDRSPEKHLKLDHCRNLEREVDRLVDEVLQRQGSLFSR